MPRDPNENMAVSLALAGLAFVVTLIIGRPIDDLPALNGRSAKQVRDELTTHIVKTGTPTMGGVMIAASVVLVTLDLQYGRPPLDAAADRRARSPPASWARWMTGMNLVGGTAERHDRRASRFVWLTLFAVVAALHPAPARSLGAWLAPRLRAVLRPLRHRLLLHADGDLAIIAMANAVNFTDGLDTLAAGTAAIAFCRLRHHRLPAGAARRGHVLLHDGRRADGIPLVQRPSGPGHHGRYRSLAIGAALATAAFMTGQWLLLPVVGVVFVAETLSVMMQVGYFKFTRATGGRRLFKMTPLHHHFEMLGWSETQVTMRFWMVGMMAGLLGVAMALL